MDASDSGDDIRAVLMALRREAEGRATSLARGVDGIVEAASDVATDDEHDPEGHTIAWERQQLVSLLAETRDVLAAIETAEQRLDAGTYGICSGCGGCIAPERLEALPATPSCLACAGRGRS